MNPSDVLELSRQSQSGLIWKSRPASLFKSKRSCGHFNNTRAGKLAGYLAKDQNGYVCWRVEVFGVPYLASRIIWEMAHGRALSALEFIDHRDGNPLNNSIENLRLASRRQNKFNEKTRSDSQSGMKGVRKSGSKWIARHGIGGKFYLGKFDTPEEAKAARDEACKKAHGEYFRA